MARLFTQDFNHAERRFIKEVAKAPMLSREHEHDLALRWRNDHDEEALHELINAYGRLAISTATRFRNYGLPLDDLIQEGVIGLLQAAKRFDPARDIRFSTYSSWWIRSAMQDYILRNWSIVRTGTTAAQKSLFFNFRRLRARIDSAGNGVLGHDGRRAIAHALKVNIADVEMMEGRLSVSDQSLNTAVGETGEDEWQDFLADPSPLPDQMVADAHDAKVRSAWLAEALNGLSAREQQIIRERRLREEAVTLEELGQELGISKERVRQIEHKAMEKLKASIRRTMERDGHALI
ncbi:MAG: RNA polymerase factor sigma-32 [Alphaproteobacteria bacterium]|nr:RNA polymerase factor sigma-32 [Alphaproteobacteria bacterium]